MLNNKTKYTRATVQVTKSTNMQPFNKGDLKLNNVAKEEKLSHVYPNVQIYLTSLGILCDGGCTGISTKEYAVILKDKKVVLHASRDQITKLWYTDINQPDAARVPKSNFKNKSKQLFANAVLPSSTMSYTIAFIHGALFSLPISTIIAAVDNNFLTKFLGLTVNNTNKISNHLSPLPKGIYKNNAKNIKPTKLNISFLSK